MSVTPSLHFSLLFLPVQFAGSLYPLASWSVFPMTPDFTSSTKYSSNLSSILASSLFAQLMSTFSPVLLIRRIPAQPGFPSPLSPPRLPHLVSFLSEYQFCLLSRLLLFNEFTSRIMLFFLVESILVSSFSSSCLTGCR